LTSWSGAVALGGGPINAVAGDKVVGSFSPSGAHRWSRGYHLNGNAGIDGCGALVVVSSDCDFDPGCGKLLQPSSWPDPWAPNIVIARFAP
jgi:hypothetical protein